MIISINICICVKEEKTTFFLKKQLLKEITLCKRDSHSLFCSFYIRYYKNNKNVLLTMKLLQKCINTYIQLKEKS